MASSSDNTTISKPFSQRLAAWRAREQLQQFAAAHLLGYNRTYLSAVESGLREPGKKFVTRFEIVEHLSFTEAIKVLGSFQGSDGAELSQRILKAMSVDKVSPAKLANALGLSTRDLRPLLLGHVPFTEDQLNELSIALPSLNIVDLQDHAIEKEEPTALYGKLIPSEKSVGDSDSLTVELSDELQSRVHIAAEKAGLTPEELAITCLRIGIEQVEATGETKPIAKEVLFRAISDHITVRAKTSEFKSLMERSLEVAVKSYVDETLSILTLEQAAPFLQCKNVRQLRALCGRFGIPIRKLGHKREHIWVRDIRAAQEKYAIVVNAGGITGTKVERVPDLGE